ncbi:MAG TPA: hypothetical protein VF184_00695 [Phycisphaeraceae bacterium]
MMRIRTSSCFRTVVPAMIGFATVGLLLQHAVAAPFEYENTFEGADNTQPEGWQPIDVGADRMRIVNNAYQYDGGTPTFGGAHYTGDGSQLWQDYTVSVDFNATFWSPTTSTWSGVAARVSDDAEDMYIALVRGNQLRLWQRDGGSLSAMTNEQIGDTFTYSAGETWRISLSVTGDDQVVAQLFDDTGTLVSTTTAEGGSNPLHAGSVGVVGFWSSGNGVRYSNLEVSGTARPGMPTGSIFATTGPPNSVFSMDMWL